MNSSKLQSQSCHSFLLFILICCSLCASLRQVNSATIPLKQSSSLVRRLIGSIKSADELGPLKVLTDERVEHLLSTGQGPGKIETFHQHMDGIVKKVSTQIDFREWLTKRTKSHKVEIQDNSLYAERDFIDHLLAWHKDKWAKKGILSPSSDQIKKILKKYPFSLGEAVKLDTIPEPVIPVDSYLKTILMTPGEFIERYLPRHDPYRTRFWAKISQDFTQSVYYPESTAYFVSELFTRYEKFALEEVNQFSEEMPRHDFIDRYLPEIYGVRLEFKAYLDSIPRFSKPEKHFRAKEYMIEYLKWAKEYHIWTPSHTERFFSYGQGEDWLKEPFIKYLYKKGAQRGLSPDLTYFRGEIQAEYSSFLHERNHASFAKKILYKFQKWKYNLHLGWISFRKSLSNLDGWDKFFLGFGAFELGDIFAHMMVGG
ncbi:hypothetical protein DFH28DRAFT_215857 [Melampsora americana]|nr:hypothetical protein DFH28DRAFT_254828 [Melampsora americana]KAH9816102.1 hypothetical protein DFH28DRAFT_215857 [Melampsora americana]